MRRIEGFRVLAGRTRSDDHEVYLVPYPTASYSCSISLASTSVMFSNYSLLSDAQPFCPCQPLNLQLAPISQEVEKRRHCNPVGQTPTPSEIVKSPALMVPYCGFSPALPKAQPLAPLSCLQLLQHLLRHAQHLHTGHLLPLTHQAL